MDLQAKPGPPKKVQLLDLPSEVLVRICNHLPLIDIQHSLRHVNKLFWDLTKRHFDIINHIGLDVFFSYFADDGIENVNEYKYDKEALSKLKSFLEEYRPNVLSLTLTFRSDVCNGEVDLSRNNSGFGLNDGVLQVFPHLTKLTALRLHGRYYYADEFDKINEAFGKLHHLQQLSLTEMHTDVWWSLEKLKNLKSLHIDNLDDVDSTFRLSVRQGGSWDNKRVPPRSFLNMTDLKIQNFRLYSRKTIEFEKFDWMWQHFPSLKHLDIGNMKSGVQTGGVPMIKGLHDNCKKLETLQLIINVDPAFDKPKEKNFDRTFDPDPDQPPEDNPIGFANLKRFKITIKAKGGADKMQKHFSQWPIIHDNFKQSKVVKDGTELTYATEARPDKLEQLTTKTKMIKTRTSVLNEILGEDRWICQDCPTGPENEITTSDEDELEIARMNSKKKPLKKAKRSKSSGPSTSKKYKK